MKFESLEHFKVMTKVIQIIGLGLRIIHVHHNTHNQHIIHINHH